METSLFKNWWLLTINGVAALIFGILVIFFPSITLLLLVYYFGILALFTGMFFMLGGILNKGKTKLWRFWIIDGLINFVIGLIIILKSLVSIEIFAFLVAVWALVTGTTQITSAILLREIAQGKWLYIVNGMIGIIFSVIIVLKASELTTLSIIVGFYAIILGIFSLIISFIMRKFREEQKRDTIETYRFK